MDNNYNNRYYNTKNYSSTIPKEFMLKKIHLDDYPKLKAKLNIFFTDINKYFETSFGDKYIIVGKKSKNSRLGSSLDTSGKSKNRKLLRRMSVKSSNILKSSVDSQRYLINSQKLLISNVTDDKKKNFTSYDENILKPGQRFINDSEVEQIFSIFKEIRKMNNSKNDNANTQKELDKSKISNFFNSKKSNKNKSNNNSNKFLINLKKNNIKKNFYSVKNDKANNNKINKNFFSDDDNANSHINDMGNYKTHSTFYSIKDDYSIRNKYINTENNIIVNKSRNNSYNLLREKKLKKKQNQYISIELDTPFKNKMANILTLQEKSLMNRKKEKNVQSHINNYILSKTKKSKSNLLTLQEDNYRPNIEIKMKLHNLQKKLNPDKFYNWFKDLHSSQKNLHPYEYIPNIETIRNPKNMKILNPSNFTEKNNYMKKIIPKKYFRDFNNDLNNTNKNYESLIVEGVDLLNFENDLFKKLKGRKIINDFERLFSPSKKKNQNIYSNIEKNIFTQKIKPAFNIYH